jgi:hypothetical protein
MSDKRVVGCRVKVGASDLHFRDGWKEMDGVGRGMPLGVLFVQRKGRQAAPERQRPLSFRSRPIKSRDGFVKIDRSSFSSTSINTRPFFVTPCEKSHEPGSRECPYGAERK